MVAVLCTAHTNWYALIVKIKVLPMRIVRQTKRMQKKIPTCALDEVELGFFWNPESIPNSAKKFEDFGGATWLIIWGPPEPFSDGSTYSNREEYDGWSVALVLSKDIVAGAGSSGFWS